MFFMAVLKFFPFLSSSLLCAVFRGSLKAEGSSAGEQASTSQEKKIDSTVSPREQPLPLKEKDSALESEVLAVEKRVKEKEKPAGLAAAEKKGADRASRLKPPIEIPPDFKPLKEYCLLSSFLTLCLNCDCESE
jgi:hypothetical protein